MKLPFSPLLILLSFVIYGIQFHPLMAIIGIAFLLPLWSIVLINGAMIGIVIETFARPLYRVWLIVPILWFGGAVKLALDDRATLDQLRTIIAEHNQSLRIPFDADRQALVLVGPMEPVGIEHFDIPVLYSRSRERGGFLYRAERLASREACEAIAADPTFRAAGVEVGWIDENPDRDEISRWTDDFCTVSLPEEPQIPLVTLERSVEETSMGRLKVSAEDMTISMPDGSRYLFRGGEASPLWWVPLPVMGCLPTYSGLDCSISLMRGSDVPLVGDEEDNRADLKEFGRSLGLLRRSEAWKPTPSQEIMARAEASRKAEAARAIAELDRAIGELDDAIGGAAGKLGTSTRSILEGRNDILEPRLGRIIAAIERDLGRAHAPDGKNRSSAFELYMLVRELPPEMLETYSARLDALYERDRRFRFRPPELPTGAIDDHPIVVTAGD